MWFSGKREEKLSFRANHEEDNTVRLVACRSQRTVLSLCELWTKEERQMLQGLRSGRTCPQESEAKKKIYYL
jgi:hypothetical protein